MWKWGRWVLPCGIFGAISLATASAAATDVSGTVATQTWTLAGSPYVLTGDVTVPVGATLTIEAGVVVRPSPTDGLAAGASPTLVELIVNGALVVSGTPESPVSFVPASPTGQHDWYGIRGGTLEIEGAIIKNAEVGILASGYPYTTTLSGLTIDGCATGISNYTPEATLERSVLTHNGIGLDTAETVAIDHCTFDHNGTGIRFHAETPDSLQVRNTVITHSTTYGIQPMSYIVVLSQVVVFDGGVPAGSQVFGLNTCNPLLSDGLRPTSHSPARKAAADGSDIGALPYAGDATPGLYGTLFEDTTLDAAGSPYDIAGDLDVAPDATLTLAPGAVLRFAASSDIMKCGDSTTTGELRVRGGLNALGTAEAKVHLSSSTPLQPYTWGGVFLLADDAPSSLSNLEISGGNDCISRLAGGAWTLSRSEIHHCGTGVRSAVSVALDALTIHDVSGFGVLLTQYLSADTQTSTVENLVSYSNGYAIESDLSATSSVAITNITSFGDQVGVANNFANVSVASSIFAGNSSPLAGTETVTHSNFWDYDNAPEVDLDASLNVDPMFVNAPLDLHLLPGSPCIDTGTSTDAPDHDHDGAARPLDGDGSGTAQWDMGAYEASTSTSTGGGEGGAAGGGEAGSSGEGGAGGVVVPPSSGGSGNAGRGGTGNVGTGGEESPDNGGQASGAKAGQAGKGGTGARGGTASGGSSGRGLGGNNTGGTRAGGGGSPSPGGHAGTGEAAGNPPPADDSGCGCRTAPRRTPPIAAGFGLFMLMALGVRRRSRTLRR